MKQFHQGMFVKSLPPAEVLRSAQLEMRKHKHWNSPYYWATFALQGSKSSNSSSFGLSAQRRSEVGSTASMELDATPADLTRFWVIPARCHARIGRYRGAVAARVCVPRQSMPTIGTSCHREALGAKGAT